MKRYIRNSANAQPTFITRTIESMFDDIFYEYSNGDPEIFLDNIIKGSTWEDSKKWILENVPQIQSYPEFVTYAKRYLRERQGVR